MHTLRHNYTTMLFEKNVDLMTVRYICGHSDIQTTMAIYTHYTESLKTSGMQKVIDL